MSIKQLLAELENAKCTAQKRDQQYIELHNILKQEDDMSVLSFMKQELWRFFNVFVRDIEDEK